MSLKAIMLQWFLGTVGVPVLDFSVSLETKNGTTSHIIFNLKVMQGQLQFFLLPSYSSDVPLP
jgi:hypothetical protein